MKKIMILGLLIIIFMMGCVNDYDDKLPPLLDENGSIIDEGPFARMNTCEGLCEEKGLVFSSCGESSVSDPDALFCNEEDIDVGMSDYCVDENGEGDYKTCCCKEEVKPQEISVIRVYPKQDLIESEELKEIPLGEIFVNNEKGEIILSTTAEDELLSALTEAIDAAKSTNLTLESEGIEIIDGGEALVMRANIIEATNQNYIFSLRGFLAFGYEWKADIFDFDLVEVDKWTASKGGKKVLEFENTPGILTSTALPPSGYTPKEHPFLTGSVLVSEEEDNIRTILDESSSFVDFLTKLVENRYLVISKGGVIVLR